MPDPLLRQKRNFEDLLSKSARKKWNVYAKRPFAGPQQVLLYLSRYTHRAAISNNRILEIDAENGTVLFSWKDYRLSQNRLIFWMRFFQVL